MTLSNRAERVLGTTERRTLGLTDFEVRADGNSLQFEGYASLFGVGYDMYGGPDKGGWTEFVDKRAFERTLSAKPDVVLNINHGEGGTGLPIARTTSGTLELRTDKKGLRPSASLDLRDPDVQALQVKVERGDVNQMSFAFRTIRQDYDKETDVRTLQELSLDRGDVSIVTNGANPATTMQLRSLLQQLAGMDVEEARMEMRALAANEMSQVNAAYTLLGHLMGCCDNGEVDDGQTTGTMLSASDSHDERDYSAADRQSMAKSGEALPDGSYPIKNQADLHNAIHAVGRGNASHDSIRKHIISRAKALGLSDMIPSDWNDDGSLRSLHVPRLSLAHARRLAMLDV